MGAASGDLVAGEDSLARPPWAAADPLMRHYYDTQWGVPVRSERGLYERITLEAFQSGLSWATILRKREAFRAAFADFDPDAVARFGPDDIVRLMSDPGIVRNRRKIEAAIQNARATVALRDSGGLSRLAWSFEPKEPYRPERLADIPTSSPESVALSKELKKRGFTFVGPTTMFALMEAAGIVNTHLVGSHRRETCGARTGEE